MQVKCSESQVFLVKSITSLNGRVESPVGSLRIGEVEITSTTIS